MKRSVSVFIFAHEIWRAPSGRGVAIPPAQPADRINAKVASGDDLCMIDKPFLPMLYIYV